MGKVRTQRKECDDATGRMLTRWSVGSIHPLVSSLAKCLRESQTRHIASSIENTSFLPHPFLNNYNTNTVIWTESELWIRLLLVYIKVNNDDYYFFLDFRPLRLLRIRCERRWYVCISGRHYSEISREFIRSLFCSLSKTQTTGLRRVKEVSHHLCSKCISKNNYIHSQNEKG